MQIKKNAPVIQSYGLAVDVLDDAIKLEVFVNDYQAGRIQSAVKVIFDFQSSMEDAGKVEEM